MQHFSFSPFFFQRVYKIPLYRAAHAGNNIGTNWYTWGFKNFVSTYFIVFFYSDFLIFHSSLYIHIPPISTSCTYFSSRLGFFLSIFFFGGLMGTVAGLLFYGSCWVGYRGMPRGDWKVR
ncbi:hypothetical protein V8F06_005862 [Rhypophila decipiens]